GSCWTTGGIGLVKFWPAQAGMAASARVVRPSARKRFESVIGCSLGLRVRARRTATPVPAVNRRRDAALPGWPPPDRVSGQRLDLPGQPGQKRPPNATPAGASRPDGAISTSVSPPATSAPPAI